MQCGAGICYGRSLRRCVKVRFLQVFVFFRSCRVTSPFVAEGVIQKNEYMKTTMRGRGFDEGRACPGSPQKTEKRQKLAGPPGGPCEMGPEPLARLFANGPAAPRRPSWCEIRARARRRGRTARKIGTLVNQSMKTWAPRAPRCWEDSHHGTAS